MRYTARHKLALLMMAKRLRDKEGISLRKSAERVQVSADLLLKWEERFSLGNNPIEALLKTKKKSIHPSPLGQLKPLKEALLKYIFEKRKQGIEISTLAIVVVASNLSTKFGKKNFIARCNAVKHFVKAHSLVYQMGTHLCQHKPEEVEAEASNYMHLIRTLLFGPHRDQRFILNMDQTLVFFLMSTKRTLEVVGKRTIHIRMSTNDTRRATVAVMIAGDGTVLPSMIIFKGKHNGRITRSEFTMYPAGHHYCCQEAAWMDKRVMLAWVEKVLAPYVAMAPEDIIPLLILDSYRCHMMASVVSKIQELGVEVKHIPGRCTSLCQPVDVGFNKPFKSHIQKMWINWMIAEGVQEGTISSPTRHDVAVWVDEAMAKMKEKQQIIKNAWLKMGFEWFDKEEGEGVLGELGGMEGIV